MRHTLSAIRLPRSIASLPWVLASLLTALLCLTPWHGHGQEPFDSIGATRSYFSVAYRQAVCFSRGNLQFNALQGFHTTAEGGSAWGVWRFAEQQYSYAGTNNDRIGLFYSGWIDLFGWGTSGWNSGATSYQPWSSSNTNNQYRPGNSNTQSLTGSYANADWGVYNAISNGGNQPGLWRTLTQSEWRYLLQTRHASTVGEMADARYVRATVAGYRGIILLPDVYAHPSGVALPRQINVRDADFATNEYSESEWQAVEAAGAVFLPLAGVRNRTSTTQIGEYGCYWTATYSSSTNAYTVAFPSTSFPTPTANPRSRGYSVRLVHDIDSLLPAIFDTSITACDSLRWRGRTLTRSGLYTDTLVAADGSDSLVCLHLTIGISSSRDTLAVAYDSLRWRGQTLTASDTLTIRLTTALGCDSAIRLCATIKPRPATVGFTDIGASQSIFTVNSRGLQVHFSQGNLQYSTLGNHTTADGGRAQGTWRFAAHQYDHLGSANDQIAASNEGWIDLFGWGTSGWNSGARAYQPWSSSTSYANYYPGGSDTTNLVGDYAHADWGVYNAISNGGDAARMWRTLRSNEWQYLFELRSASPLGSTANARFAKAQIDGCGGIILFPDAYTQPATVATPTALNSFTAPFSSNLYTLEQWAALEAAGAIFLPAAGYRRGTTTNDVGSNGEYWASTGASRNQAGHAYFVGTAMNPNNRNARYYGYAVRLVRDDAFLTDTTATACDSLQWHGQMCRTSGVYADTLRASDGRDSIVSLHLTLNQSRQTDTTITACDSLRWQGALYSTSGNFTQTLAPIDGCPHTAHLHLTIHRSTSDTLRTTASTTFTWHGQDYSESGIYRHDTLNAAGCDSLCILMLSIGTSSTEFRTACDSLTWKGHTYTTDGTYQFDTLNATGHDSTITLILAIHHTVHESVAETACTAFTWHQQLYTAGGTYTHTHPDSYGCPQTDTLHLTLLGSPTTDSTVAACDSLWWQDTLLLTSGSYSRHYTLPSGCDSTVMLHLTLHHSSPTDTQTLVTYDIPHWNNRWLLTSGIYQFDTLNAEGCDSTAVLDLTLLRRIYWRIDLVANGPWGDLLPDTTNYVQNDSLLTIEVRPYRGRRFVAWVSGTDTISRANPYTLVATRDSTIMAVFAGGDDDDIDSVPDSVNIAIKVKASGMGTTSPSPGRYRYASTDTIHIDATAFTGYRFVRWAVEGTPALTLGSHIDIFARQVNTGGEATVTAVFEPEPSTTYLIDAQSADSTMGHVEGAGRYNAGDGVMLTAIAHAGFHFSHWSSGETDSVLLFTATADRSLIAYFSQGGNTGIGTASNEGIRVYSPHRGIIAVQAAEGSMLHLYDAQGRLVGHRTAASAHESFQVAASGLYLLCADGQAVARIMVLK